MIGDTADAYRLRVLNIAVPQVTGAAGVVVGSVVHDSAWVAVTTLTAVRHEAAAVRSLAGPR
ncbi:hypothetical protein ABZ869_32375 [Streptomyces sp. NPDC046928]|uniref:hypothetical protein n=1 Tax=Streptomyces sp. NPDC046928 TaxID=3155021 RepID=UPI0033CF9B43